MEAFSCSWGRSHAIFTVCSLPWEVLHIVGTRPAIDCEVEIALLAEGRYLAQRQPKGLVTELRHRGCAVTLIEPDSGAISLTDRSWLAGVSVCVARGRSDAVLSRLLAAERHGIPTLNRASAVAAVVDKAGMAVALASAGIPTPPTILGSPPQLAAELPSDLYPVIVKPIRGDNCRGLAICESADAVRRLAPTGEPLLAQPFLRGDGSDLKLYGVAETVWAVRKPSPLSGDQSPWSGHRGMTDAIPVELTSDLRELALRCGELFGLELFGVDCLVTPAGPVVIEVNDFPNFTGVPDADAALADHVLATAGEAPRALDMELVS
jgi:ribosomal protein S6--L-glutamate ligase